MQGHPGLLDRRHPTSSQGDVGEVPLEAVLHQQSRHGQALSPLARLGRRRLVLTDFHLYDGFSHFLLLDRASPAPPGRIAQRLAEIETYRVAALASRWPRRHRPPGLARRGQSSPTSWTAWAGRGSAEDDRAVLARLSRLAAEVERSVVSHHLPLRCRRGHYRLVRQRIDDLREQRSPGFPPIGEFMDRRPRPRDRHLKPRSRRQDDLRPHQATRSRCAPAWISRSNANQVAAQMNRRAKIQPHLQETVEGLSVVAITYYASQRWNPCPRAPST